MGFFILIGSVGIVMVFASTTVWLLWVWQADLRRQRGRWRDAGTPLPHESDDPLRCAARAVQAASFDAQAAAECASELEHIAVFAVGASWPRVPSSHLRIQLVHERARKARDYAWRAHTHAQAARSCAAAPHALPAATRLATVERHAALAKQAHLNARDLREFIVMSWRRDGLSLPR
jgi:hypothetical protein